MARIAAVVVALAFAGMLATCVTASAHAPGAATALAPPPGLASGPPGMTPPITPPEANTPDGNAPDDLEAARSRTKSKSETKKAKPKSVAHRDPHLSSPSDAESTPAFHYAQLSQADCEAELGARHIDFIRETAAPVLAPVRLTGPLRGVVFRSDANEKARATSPYEIVDCRLVLALDDFAQILARHDIVEVRHYSMYRPPKPALDGEIGKRHSGALAIDAGRFYDRWGGELDVNRDFHGAIGDKTCGDDAAPHPATDAALQLRAILCEAVDARLFNVVLTPNYNRPHKNHFHLEITAGVSWFLVH
ncbi:MAG TPA: extensin family protein [Kofleriaceae bacterium]|nr:extensin family protein [Kofleriaceae bacterium]